MFVPLQSIVHKAAAQHGAAAVAPDGVHPSPLGAELLAQAWLEAYGRP